MDAADRSGEKSSRLLRPLSLRPMEYSGVGIVLVSLALSLPAGQAVANEWQLVQGDDQESVLIDRGSIEREGVLAKAWILKSFSTEIRLGHDLYPHRSQKLYYEFNCTDDSFRVGKWLLTQGAYGTGNPVWAGYSVAPDRQTASKGSVEALAAKIACAPPPLVVGKAN